MKRFFFTLSLTWALSLGLGLAPLAAFAAKVDEPATVDPLARYGGFAGAAICFHLLNKDCLPMQGVQSLVVTGKSVSGDPVEMRYEADRQGRLTRYFHQRFDEDGKKAASFTLGMEYEADSVVLMRVFSSGMKAPVARLTLDNEKLTMSLESEYFPKEVVQWNPAQRRLGIVTSGKSGERRFDLDGEGNLLKTIVTSDGSERPVMLKLNEYGDPARMFSVTDDGDAYIFVYDYDYNDQGHWVEQYISVKGYDVEGQLSRALKYWPKPVISDTKSDQ